MFAKRIGPDYNKFLKLKTKKKQFIDKNDGFNMSMIHIKNDEYLFAIRILGSQTAYKGYKIIPGNYSGKKKTELCKKLGDFICSRIDFGKNFFWGDWNANFNDNTILFIGKLNHDTLSVTPNTQIKPYVFSNVKLHGLPYKYSDVRLFTANGKLYCYNGYITSIYQINIDNASASTNTSINVQKVYDNVCKNIKTFDKNWSYITSIQRNKSSYFMFLNWFENNALTVSYINLQKPHMCIKENLITMKRDIISGIGSKMLPMFSFGTPTIEVKRTEPNTNSILWIGVGHTKIMTTMKYENKKLIDFKFAINKNLRENGNYIQHNSYIYLVYFYTLEKNITKTGQEQYKMMLSDSYLYYFPEQKYTFSINFPMGIDIKNDNVYVSLGVGDYYNFIIRESLAYIINACCHNLEEFDISKYDFKLRTPTPSTSNSKHTPAHKPDKTQVISHLNEDPIQTAKTSPIINKTKKLHIQP